MADADSNLIKPVESLQNITGLKPINPRNEKKQRRQPQKKNSEEHRRQLEESVEEELFGEEFDENDRDSIDYCA